MESYFDNDYTNQYQPNMESYFDNDYTNQYQPRTYCYPFYNIQNLTEFEARVADKLCSLESTTQNVRYQLGENNDVLKGVTIASLVLNAVTVLSIFIYLLYSLYSYRKKQKQVAI